MTFSPLFVRESLRSLSLPFDEATVWMVSFVANESGSDLERLALGGVESEDLSPSETSASFFKASRVVRFPDGSKALLDDGDSFALLLPDGSENPADSWFASPGIEEDGARILLALGAISKEDAPRGDFRPDLD